MCTHNRAGANLYAGQKDWNNALTVMRGLVQQFPNNLDVLDQ